MATEFGTKSAKLDYPTFTTDWHSETDWRIATPMHALTAAMFLLNRVETW